MNLPKPILTEVTPASFREFCAGAAAIMAEQVFDRACHNDASIATKMDAAKWFAKMADYEPKPNVNANAGNGFQLVINFSSAPPEHYSGGVTIEQESSIVATQDLLASPPQHIVMRPLRNSQFMVDATAEHESD